MPREPIGTFEKDGRQKLAYSPAEVVNLRFDGWAPVDADAEASVTATRTGPKPPPLTGTGSGGDAWAKYANTLGVSVEPDAKREDIVQAIRAAGHPTEPAE
jgi:hypothetical protein